MESNRLITVLLAVHASMPSRSSDQHLFHTFKPEGCFGILRLSVGATMSATHCSSENICSLGGLPPVTQSCRSVATDQTAQKGGTAPCAAACRMTTKPVIAATVIAPWGRPSAGARSMAGDDAPLGDCLIPCLEISAGCTAVTRTCTVRASQKKRTLMICRALD
jgi:hypothetical protein